jgi:RNA-directed DNA polymerase
VTKLQLSRWTRFNRMTTLLKTQKGKCTHCGLFFREEDVLEVDHIIPQAKGGKDEYKNLQILHRHCHDAKTAKDGLAVKCT